MSVTNMGIKVGVLGGMGLMAEAALHDLARNPGVDELIAADLRLDRQKAVAARLPNRRKVRFARVDLAETAKAARLLKSTAVIINAAWYELNLKAMDLAQAVGAHYVDLGGLYHMTMRQLKRSREFERSGLLAALGCGSTPGITNMMVAKMAEDFDRVDTVNIYDASHDPSIPQDRFLPPFSIRTMLDEYVMPAPIFERGRIVEAPAHSRGEKLRLKAPIGQCAAGVVRHSELATLPGYLRRKGIRNLAFKIVYPEEVKEQLEFLVSMGFAGTAPVQVNGSAVSPRNFITAMALAGAAAPTGRPRDFEVLRVRMSGLRARRTATSEWDCEIRPTRALSAGVMGVGFSAAIAAQLILEGRLVRRSGVYAPESCLDSSVFFRELAARKVFRLVERKEMAHESFAG